MKPARGRARTRGRRRAMASVVHFHFRNAKAQDMVKFEGDHVSLQDLKLLIAKKKGLAKATEIDFAITNSETNEGAAALPALCVRACAPAPNPGRLRTRAVCRDPSRTAPARLLPRRAGAFGGRRSVALLTVCALVQSTPIPGCSSPRTRAWRCAR